DLCRTGFARIFRLRAHPLWRSRARAAGRRHSRLQERRGRFRRPTRQAAAPPGRCRAYAQRAFRRIEGNRLMAKIELQGLVKEYGKTRAVHGIDLTIEDGEFVVFVGPSGCGKSTTLRMIAGLEDISGGHLLIGGEVVNQREPKQRNIAMVFQNYAIYPHMTVGQNIGFGLYTSKLSKAEKQQRIEETGKILGLEKLLDRR